MLLTALWLIPSAGYLTATAGVAVAVLGISTPILALNEPAVVTSFYEVLEPETWVGKPLPILDHIDITHEIKQGTWLLLLYHHDCPDCRRAIARYQQMAHDLAGNEDFLRIALIHVPPCDPTTPADHWPCALGRLSDMKSWFVTTPSAALVYEGEVKAAWEQSAPNLDIIVAEIAELQARGTASADFRVNMNVDPFASR